MGALSAERTPVTFTTATPADARHIAALHDDVARHLERATPGARPWRVPPDTQIAKQMKTTDTVLAREGDHLVASFRLDPTRGFCGVARFTEVDSFVYLLEMAVRPSHQRRGVGRLCLEEVERRARAQGAKAIRLDTNDDPIQAAAFYEACGYREVMHYAQTIYFERVF